MTKKLVFVKADTSVEEVTTLDGIRPEGFDKPKLILDTDGCEFLMAVDHPDADHISIHTSEHSNKANIDVLLAYSDNQLLVEQKRVSSEALAMIRELNKRQLQRHFLPMLFTNGYAVLPDKDVMLVLTDKGKTFVFNKNACWEITAVNELVPVLKIPKYRVVDYMLGEHSLDNSLYSYITQSTYITDISFKKEIDGASKTNSSDQGGTAQEVRP